MIIEVDDMKLRQQLREQYNRGISSAIEIVEFVQKHQLDHVKLIDALQNLKIAEG